MLFLFDHTIHLCYTNINSYSYYFFNAHGDVINRVNSDGVVLKSYKYDSFGNIINPATVGDPNDPIYVDQSPFGYAGEYLDKENGEIYLRARYYNSEQGRFVTEDPSKYGSNWYCYCDNNPVTHIDPSGLHPGYIYPQPEEGRGDSPGNAGNTGSSNTGNAPTRAPEQVPSFEDGRGVNIEITPPKPPTSKPAYAKYYNPDHSGFESSFCYNNGEEVEENSTLLEEIAIGVTTNVSSDKMNNYIIEQISIFEGVLSNDVVKTALKNADDLFKFGGPFLDFVSQLSDGRSVDDALMMTGFHLVVEWAVVLATIAFLPTTISLGTATIIGIAIASIINTVLDHYLESLF